MIFAGIARGNPNSPLDHPYTLRNSEPFLLEEEYHRLIQSDAPRSYIFPRPCKSALDSSQICSDVGHWQYKDSLSGREIALSPIGESEFRTSRGDAESFSFGAIVEGNSGPLSFYLDTRTFTEFHTPSDTDSFDREFVERQDASSSGSIAYTSYSRYRSNVCLDLGWGRIAVSHDAVHWGPALFTNLVFNQESIPFNQLTFTAHLGPISVQSLYGSLITAGHWNSETIYGDRTLFAHRYEWRPARNWIMGVSEQLILYKTSDPFAFAPVVPLFVAKAGNNEGTNNGNIAADVSYRIPGWLALYSEFLIDDLQSPTALFNDYWGNKWAWMAGAHLSRGAVGWERGIIAEYSRVEPWVYTHYNPNTAQAENGGYPLGNPYGPNSQTIITKGYVRLRDRFYFGLLLGGVWRGKDPGSSIEDIQRDVKKGRKEFLAGSTGPVPKVGLDFGYTRKYASLLSSLGYNGDPIARVELIGHY